MKANLEELARLESRNVGKPISGARGEALGASLVFEYYGGAANKVFGETIPVSKPGLDFTLREPIGVVGLIVPWNFPILMASWKLGPALAAGNTCILKPASWTPLRAIRLGELALEAGFPAGVVNVVTGPGGSAGAAIAGHAGIGKVAFTGETTTGQEIMRLAASNVKKVSLELGGKSPNIVFADADLERFARESPYAVFDNCGQDCCARSRIFVERSVHDQVVELFAAATRKVKVGDPADDATEVGPDGPSPPARARPRLHRDRPAGGCRAAHRRRRPDDPALAAGTYVLPTVFTGVSNDMRIAREEIFGPVVAIIPFDTEEEAIRLANATPYGLSGSIWSRDIGRALRTAKGVQAGRPQRELATARSTPRRRSAATRCRASAGSSGCTRSRCTPRRRTCSSTSARPVAASPEADRRCPRTEQVRGPDGRWAVGPAGRARVRRGRGARGRPGLVRHDLGGGQEPGRRRPRASTPECRSTDTFDGADGTVPAGVHWPIPVVGSVAVYDPQPDTEIPASVRLGVSGRVMTYRPAEVVVRLRIAGRRDIVDRFRTGPDGTYAGWLEVPHPAPAPVALLDVSDGANALARTAS